MIFVTVGNDFRSFDRLLRTVDEMAARIPVEIVVQRGYSNYLPGNVRHFDFVTMEESIDFIRNSELVVSHAGIGTIILCKKYGTPILILPRRKRYGEHMNDHQLEIAEALERREEEGLYVARQEGELEEMMLKALQVEARKPATEHTGRLNLLQTLKAFIENAR